MHGDPDDEETGRPPLFLAPTESLTGDTVLLDGPEGRHAATVRRLRVGERIRVTDGHGLVIRGVVAAVHKDALEITVRKRKQESPPALTVTVAQALAKGERSELAVEMMTEVGVDAVLPWAAARSVVTWKADKADRGADKWRAAAAEAAKQSRRAFIPDIGDVVDTPALATAVAGSDLAVLLDVDGDQMLASLDVPERGHVLLVVGPEGGVNASERSLLLDAGAVPARLGPTVLRSSTAGAVAAALLLARGRWT